MGVTAAAPIGNDLGVRPTHGASGRCLPSGGAPRKSAAGKEQSRAGDCVVQVARHGPIARRPGRRLRGTNGASMTKACIAILGNGDHVATSWQGHGRSGVQVLEYDPAGTLVWSWQQDASYVSSLQAVIVLDGLNLDLLHVDDTDGTLVPVS